MSVLGSETVSKAAYLAWFPRERGLTLVCRLHVIPSWSSFYPPRPTPAGVTEVSGIFSSHIVCENAEGLPVFLTLLREIKLLNRAPGRCSSWAVPPQAPPAWCRGSEHSATAGRTSPLGCQTPGHSCVRRKVSHLHRFPYHWCCQQYFLFTGKWGGFCHISCVSVVCQQDAALGIWVFCMVTGRT